MSRNNNLRYSILIPCYNTSKYIKRCIDSVLNQKTENNYEIIICDDGSTDNTVEIIETYHDEKIKLLRNETNKRGIITRNRLVRESKGDYIIWVDSDDELLSDALSFLDERLKVKEFDIVEFSYQSIKNGNTYQSIIPQKFLNDDTMAEVFFNMGLKWVMWGKAIKREVMEKSLPPDVTMQLDDVFFTLAIYLNAKSYTSSGDKSLYRYYCDLGFWSTIDLPETTITLEKFKGLCKMRYAELMYNSNLLDKFGIKDKYLAKLLQACNFGHLLVCLLKIENVVERQIGLNELNKLMTLKIENIKKYSENIF